MTAAGFLLIVIGLLLAAFTQRNDWWYAFSGLVFLAGCMLASAGVFVLLLRYAP